MKKDKIVNLIVLWIGIIVVAVLGAVFTSMGMAWFDGLQKPAEWVPQMTFGIVWTVIYVAFAIYVFVAIRRNWMDKDTIILLGLNGLLNVIWCVVFFSVQSLLGGLVTILFNMVLAFMLFAHIAKKGGRTVSLILTIYPLWLALATCLNLAVWILN